MKLNVGDKVFIVFPRVRYRQGSVDKTFWAVVEKVGRRWAYLDGSHGKIDMENGSVHDNYYNSMDSPGKAFPSEVAWLENTYTEKLWRNICAYFDSHRRYCVPDNLNKENLEQIIEILNITSEGD